MSVELLIDELKDAGTVASIAELTDSAVDKLLQGAEVEAESWFARGEIVDKYIRELERLGESKNPFELLASHKRSIHKENQLRNYRSCYRLREDLGGDTGAPKATLSHYIRVVPRRIKLPEKRELLERVVREDLSVAALAKIVENRLKELRGKRKPASPIDWTALDSLARRTLKQLGSLKTHRPPGPVPTKLRERLLDARVMIEDLLKSEVATEVRTDVPGKKRNTPAGATAKRRRRKDMCRSSASIETAIPDRTTQPRPNAVKI